MVQRRVDASRDTVDDACAFAWVQFMRWQPQLIAEANAAMRREQFRIGADQQPRSPRAARLRELEEEPPAWLCASIGRPPGKTLRAEAVLAWRRAALAIARTAVDLPLPFGPTSATHSPASTVRETSASATRRPYSRRSSTTSSTLTTAGTCAATARGG
jgi:hypothetical protein